MKREESGLRAFPKFLRVKLNALYLFKSHLLRDHIDQEGGGGGGGCKTSVFLVLKVLCES